MIDCLRRHEELCRKLPWWRKDYYGWPIETFIGKKFKSFTRLVCINIKKPFQWVYWKWRRLRGYGKFEKMVLPVIKNMDTSVSAKDFLLAQPMQEPVGLVFYLDYKYDESKNGRCRHDALDDPPVWEPTVDKKRKKSEI